MKKAETNLIKTSRNTTTATQRCSSSRRRRTGSGSRAHMTWHCTGWGGPHLRQAHQKRRGFILCTPQTEEKGERQKERDGRRTHPHVEREKTRRR